MAVHQRVLQGEIQTEREVQIASQHAQVRLKGQRYMDLMQIKKERAAYFADEENKYVKQLGGVKNIPGASTGLVVMNFKTVARQAVPFLEIDRDLLRELSNLEEEVGRMMGFIDPITALQVGDTNNVNVVVIQCDADLRGED